MRRWICFALIALWFSQLVGCALLYELQPHRIRRLNRGPAPSIDPDFTTMNSTPTAPSLIAADEQPLSIVRAQQ